MYRKGQLVMHYGNVCQISNIFINRNNERCCDLLYLDGGIVTATVSSLYPYLGNMKLNEFKKIRDSNIFKNNIYKNSLMFIFVLTIVMILSFNGFVLF